MKVELVDNGFIVIPETDFEIQYINKTFSRGEKLIAFVKCGLSPADLIGVKVCKDISAISVSSNKHDGFTKDEEYEKYMNGEVCQVRDFCKFKECENKNNEYLNLSNCTCRGCLENSENKQCESSGDSYNTNNDCIMLK